MMWWRNKPPAEPERVKPPMPQRIDHTPARAGAPVHDRELQQASIDLRNRVEQSGVELLKLLDIFDQRRGHE